MRLRCFKDGLPMDFIAVRRIIIKATHAVALGFDNIFDYLRVAACPEEVNCCH